MLLICSVILLHHLSPTFKIKCNTIKIPKCTTCNSHVKHVGTSQSAMSMNQQIRLLLTAIVIYNTICLLVCVCVSMSCCHQLHERRRLLLGLSVIFVLITPEPHSRFVFQELKNRLFVIYAFSLLNVICGSR